MTYKQKSEQNQKDWEVLDRDWERLERGWLRVEGFLLGLFFAGATALFFFEVI